MYLSTVDGHFIEVDQGLADLLGYETPTDVIDSITDISSQLYVEFGTRNYILNELRLRGRVCSYETLVYRKDGSTVWVSEYARAVWGAHGEFKAIEGALIDISNLKSAAYDLLTASEEIVQQLSAIRENLLVLGKRRLVVKDGPKLKFIELANITSIRSDGDSVRIQTTDGNHSTVREQLTALEKRLGGSTLFRISKSTLINTRFVNEMRPRGQGDYEFFLDDGECLASGPTYREEVQMLLRKLQY